LQKLRAPSGAPVLVQTHDGDPSLYQCGGAETRLFLVQSATEVFDLRIPASSEKSPCDGKGPRAELTIEQGTLTGARLVSNTADTPEVEEKWTETAHVGFAKGQYIMYQAGK
jgi:hypothetical protein